MIRHYFTLPNFCVFPDFTSSFIIVCELASTEAVIRINFILGKNKSKEESLKNVENDIDIGVSQ